MKCQIVIRPHYDDSQIIHACSIEKNISRNMLVPNIQIKNETLCFDNSCTICANMNQQITKEFVMNNHKQMLMDRYLFMFQFTEKELKKFVDCVSMKRILITQKLSMQFVIEYILNPKYHVNDSDASLVIADVLQYQPHLSLAEYKTVRDALRRNNTKNQKNEDNNLLIVSGALCATSCTASYVANDRGDLDLDIRKSEQCI